MKRSIIQEDTTKMINTLIEKTNVLKGLNHKPTKGRLIELLTSDVLSKFLTIQFGHGTGIIINQKGEQSEQIDIIIYDKRLVPPFMENSREGVYPAESVLATIQVRSWIDKGTIKSYAASTRRLHEEIYDPESSLYRDSDKFRPLCCLLGFYDKGIFKNNDRNEILRWLWDNARPLFGVCLVDRFSWLRVVRPPGALHLVDQYNEETKAFIAILLDNVRTEAQRRYLSLVNVEHRDWLGIYTRDQGGIKEEFERRSKANTS